jgi:proline iminopeptidase
MISLWGCVKENFITEEGNLVPKTVDVDGTIPSISVNGTVLHAETFGNPDSAMIVVLHGGPGADYRHLLNCREFASQGYYVVFYDQRGSGLSKRHSKSSYSIQTMLDDLSAVIAHYRKSPAQKVFLLGHSWGAILATSFIDKYPTAISGTILAEPGGFTWPDIEEYVTRSRDIRITSELAADFLYADQFITGKKDEHAILDYKYALLSSSEGDNDNPTGNEGSLLFWRAGAVVNQALFELGNKEKPDWTTHLSQYHTRVLFVYSERNRAYGAPYAQKVSSAYPNVQLFKVNGAGHDMISFPTGWNNFFPTALNYLNSLK